MDLEMVQIFGDARFTRGGDGKGKTCDLMHFQFGTGY